jgi:hypothetical protein
VLYNCVTTLYRWILFSRKLWLWELKFPKLAKPGFFLLVYINCTKGFHYDISMGAPNVLWSNPPPLFLFSHILTGESNFNKFYYSTSYMHVKYFDIFTPPSPSTFTLPLHCLLPQNTPPFYIHVIPCLSLGLDSVYRREYAVFVFLALAYFT